MNRALLIGAGVVLAYFVAKTAYATKGLIDHAHRTGSSDLAPLLYTPQALLSRFGWEVQHPLTWENNAVPADRKFIS